MKRYFIVAGALVLGAVASVAVPSFADSPYFFGTNLSVGSNNSDVYALQHALNCSNDTQIAISGIGSAGNETTYFGVLTQSAVKRFQEKYASEVLAPAGLTQSTGFVGSLTREKLSQVLNASLLCANASTTAIMPATIQGSNIVAEKPSKGVATISSVSPTQGGNETKITILGSGFAETNTVRVSFDPVERYENVKSTNNGTKIVFELDSDVIRALERHKKNLTAEQYNKMIEVYPDVPVGIGVDNGNGLSNFEVFTITVE